jgi:nitrite reductase/ring-hydroxylating ferredoxin subunit
MTRPAGRLSRRHMLAITVAGAASGVVSLSGCGGSTKQNEAEVSSTEGAPEQGDWIAQRGVGGPGIVAAASDIPVGGGKVYPDKRIVVARPSANMYRGYRADCTYKPCALSTLQDGLVVCPCHGCRYALADGSPRKGPATRPLTEALITVDAGMIRLLE